MAPGRISKNIHDVGVGFGTFAPACREYTHLEHDPEARVSAVVLGGTLLGPVVAVRVAPLLGNHGIEVEIHSVRRPSRSSEVVFSRGRNRFV